MVIQLANPTDKLLDEREKTHGSFVDHSRITQHLKDEMRRENAWYDKLNEMQREALEMIAHKIGRILAGDPDCADHWDDIAGYARLPVRFGKKSAVQKS